MRGDSLTKPIKMNSNNYQQDTSKLIQIIKNEICTVFKIEEGMLISNSKKKNIQTQETTIFIF